MTTSGALLSSSLSSGQHRLLSQDFCEVGSLQTPQPGEWRSGDICGGAVLSAEELKDSSSGFCPLITDWLDGERPGPGPPWGGGGVFPQWTRGSGPASEESRAGLGHVSDSWSPGDPRPFTWEGDKSDIKFTSGKKSPALLKCSVPLLDKNILISLRATRVKFYDSLESPNKQPM
jgi:hypothetical protein